MEDLEVYIKDSIIFYLDACINGEMDNGAINWGAMHDIARSFRSSDRYRYCFNTLMQPYYLKFIRGEFSFKETRLNLLRNFIFQYLSDYDEVAEWFSGLDIIELVYAMADNQLEGKRLLQLLDLLVRKGFRPHVREWPKERIESEIGKLGVNGNWLRGEMLCILLSYLLIEERPWSDSKKDDLEILLNNNWHFLVNVFSVMIKYIVGSKVKSFSAVANSVYLYPDGHPYVHLFYNALILRQEDLFPSERELGKMKLHMHRMEEIMKSHPKKTDLDELCSILFGGDFEQMMHNRHFKTYDELASQVKQLESSVKCLAEMAQSTALELKEAVESSVPINVIEKNILSLPPTIALGIYGNLCIMLPDEPTWIKYSPDIHKKILLKLNESNISIANNYGPINGNVEQQMLQIPSPKIDSLPNNKNSNGE